MKNGKKLILLVEDEALIAAAESKALKKYNYEVITSPNGKKAVETALANSDIDLILMDINLGKGKMDGTEAARIILKERDIPVVFLSSHSEPDVVEKTEKITSYGYVVKQAGITVLDASIKMAFKLFDAKKEAQQHLNRVEETEERFRLTFHTSPDAVNINRLEDGLYVDINEGFTRLTGYTREDAIGKTSIDINIWHDGEDRRKLVEGLRQNGFYENLEARFRRKDGTVVTGLMSASVIHIHGVPHIISVTRDISDRIRAQEQLQAANEELQQANEELNVTNEQLEESQRELIKSDENYRSLIHRIQTGIVVHDADTSIKDCNSKAEELLGLTRDQMLGKEAIDPYWQFLNYDGESLPLEEYPVNRILSGEQRLKDMTVGVIRSPGGEPVWLSVSAVPVLKEKGAIDHVIVTFVDITDRKKTEEALRQSEEKFRTFVENANDILYTLTLDGIFTYVSPNWTDMLGHDTKNVEGRSFVPFVHPDDVDACRTFLEKVVVSGEKQAGVEYRVRHLDGTYRWHASNGSPIEDNAGNVTAFIGIARDITERKNYEAKIKSDEIFLDTVIEMSPYAMWISDREGTVIRTNRTLRKLLNLPDDTIVGQYNVLFDANLENQGVMPLVKSVYKKSEPARFEITWKPEYAGNVDFSGSPDLVIEVSMFPIIDTAGVLSNVICQWVDITEMKETEAALHEKTDMLQNILDNMRELIAITDLAGNYTFTGRSHGIMGYTQDELIGTNVLEYVHPDDLPEIEKAFAEFLANRGEPVVKYRNRCKDGSYIWLETMGKMLDDGRILFSSRDITEREKAQKDLSEKTNLLQKIMDNMHELVSITDRAGNYLFAGNSHKILGYEPDDLIGINVMEYVHPEDLPGVQEAFARSLADGKDRMVTYRYRCRDGSYIWLETAGRILDDNRLLFSSRDVTERKEAEEALRESEKKFKEIYNSTSEAIIIHDGKNGRMSDCNEATVAMYGYNSKEEMLGLTVSDFSAETEGFTQQDIEHHLKKTGNKDVHTFEWLAKKKDGEKFWVGVSLKKTNIGGEGRVLAVVRDINERKLAELAMKESQDRLLQVHTLTRVGHWDWFMDTGELRWSGEVFNIFGQDRERFVPTVESFEALIHPDDLEPFIKERENALAERRDVSIEHRIVLPGGTIRHVHETARIVRDDQGNIARVMGAVQDITDRKRSEEELRVALGEKETLLKELSHRVKNSLTVIGNIIDMEIMNTEDQATKDSLEKISVRVNSMSELYLMLYESGSTDRVAMEDYCLTLVQSLISTYNQSAVTVSMDFDPVILNINRAMPVGLIFTELITNSCKYAFPEGTSGTVTASLTQQNGTVTLTVTDDGVGLPDGFDLSENTGTGLEIVQALVGQLDGTMEIEGKGGVTVTVRFSVS